MRKIFWGFTLLAGALACSSREEAGSSADAGVDRDPVIPEVCGITPAHLDDVAPPDCEPCVGQTFSEGATCYDVPMGTECEVGDHPAWECNEVWRCSEEQHWTKAQASRSDRECSRDIFVGGACEDQYDFYSPCYMMRIKGVACLTHKAGGWGNMVAVRWNYEDRFAMAQLDRKMRLGCPCTHHLCWSGAQCIDGRYRRFDFPQCPVPP